MKKGSVNYPILEVLLSSEGKFLKLNSIISPRMSQTNATNIR